MELDWASLHKILGDTTRRNILGLLGEKGALSYTDIMTLLQITNTGRLNYHLKVMGSLLFKDETGKYQLTEQGQQAASLLKTFPERVPVEGKLPVVKVVASVILILLGVLIIVTFATVLLFSFGSFTVATGTHSELSPIAIPQNTSVYLSGWPVTSPSLNIAWSAASPLHVFILNQTQYDALVVSHATQVPLNFTGPPTSWVRDFDSQNANVTTSLASGRYYFYAWSGGSNFLDSFGMTQRATQPQSTATGLSPLFYLYISFFFLLGVSLVILGVSILTRRIWRDSAQKS